MIEIVGLGPGDESMLTDEAKNVLMHASVLMLRTERHPTVDWLNKQKIPYQSFDTFYETASDFETLYDQIALSVLEAAKIQGDVVYAVPGHPLIGEDSVQRILFLAKEAELPTKIVRSPSFIEPMMEAVGVNLSEGLQIWNAYTLDRFRPDPRLPQIIYQVDSQVAASDVKLRLMDFYPDEHSVSVVRSVGTEELSVEWMPLFEIDRHEHDVLTSLFVPSLPLEREHGLYGLVDIISALRSPEGCPWDKEQTHESLKKFALEEVYELVDAVETGDPDKLCEELGDVLLQVMLHAEIANEDGLFNIDDVSAIQSEKLIRRHPHVFSGLEVRDSAEVLHNWDLIKTAEKGEEARHSSILEGVPQAMPALMRAMEISKRVARVGFEWQNIDGVFDKIEEEQHELREAFQSGDKARTKDELGDLLFAIVNLARHMKIDPEEALRHMILRFVDRFITMEDKATLNGRNLRTLTPEEWDDLWEQAKKA